jgi:hypothetical protein
LLCCHCCSQRHGPHWWLDHYKNRANVAFFADMKEHFVIDPLISKRQQLLLATQLCRMVLKVRIEKFLSGFRTVFWSLSFVVLHRHPWCCTPFPAIPSSFPSRIVLPRFPCCIPCLSALENLQCRGSGEARPRIHGCYMQFALIATRGHHLCHRCTSFCVSARVTSRILLFIVPRLRFMLT